MRIAYVYDALYPQVTGGAERRYFELGERLAAAGHDVHFVSWTYPGAATPRHSRVQLHGVGVAPALHDGDGKRTFREAAAFAMRCIPTLRGFDVDVIDCSSIPYLSTFVTAALRGKTNARLIVTWHEYMGERWRTYLRRGSAVAARIESATARLGDERIAVSEFTARRLPAGPRTSVVENGVDVERIDRAAARIDAPKIVAAGRLVRHKRVDLVLETIARVPGATAAIIGDGPERAKLEARAAHLGICDRVRFLGWLSSVDDLYSYYRGATAVFALSEQEGFGLTVIEAQAAGAVPIAARSEFSAAADLVDDGVTGLTVEPHVDATVAALARVLEDHELQESIRANAMSSASGYDWARITERMATVYLRGERAPLGETMVPVA